MASRIDSLCRAMRDSLNLAPQGTYTGRLQNWPSTTPAVFHHMPQFRRESMELLHIVVSSDPDGSHVLDERYADRCCEFPFSLQPYVAICKRAAGVDENGIEYAHEDELEDLKQLTEEVAAYLYHTGQQVQGYSYSPVTVEFQPFYDREMWSDLRIFMGIIALQYA